VQRTTSSQDLIDEPKAGHDVDDSEPIDPEGPLEFLARVLIHVLLGVDAHAAKQSGCHQSAWPDAQARNLLGVKTCGCHTQPSQTRRLEPVGRQNMWVPHST